MCSLCHSDLHQVVRRAHRAICCHKLFCFDCIQRSLNISKCPHCRREPWSYEKCTQADTAIRETKISCRNDGCKWEGELFCYEYHVSKTCPVERVECSDCKQFIPRSSLRAHLMNECPLRITKCPHCGKEDECQKIKEHIAKECLEALIECGNDGCSKTMKRKEMETHHKDCCRQVVPCKYSKQIGCEEFVVRKHMGDHETQSLQSHFELSLQRIHELENTMTRRDYMKESQINRVPVTFKIDQFSVRKKGDEIWQSDPFYTHPQGYKLCLKVYPNGAETGKGCAISIYLYLMKGPFDNKLRWPFLCVFKVAVLNQYEDANHKIQEIKFINDREGCGEKYNQRVTSGDMASIGLGNRLFICHTELEIKKRCTTIERLKNDCIFVSVQSADVSSVSNAWLTTHTCT